MKAPDGLLHQISMARAPLKEAVLDQGSQPDHQLWICRDSHDAASGHYCFLIKFSLAKKLINPEGKFRTSRRARKFYSRIDTLVKIFAAPTKIEKPQEISMVFKRFL